jgi:hypothetical protein
VIAACAIVVVLLVEMPIAKLEQQLFTKNKVIKINSIIHFGHKMKQKKAVI